MNKYLDNLCTTSFKILINSVKQSFKFFINTLIYSLNK
jgi:hypothetical protein